MVSANIYTFSFTVWIPEFLQNIYLQDLPSEKS